MQDAVTAFHDECIGELEHMTSNEALQVRERMYMAVYGIQFTNVYDIFALINEISHCRIRT